jgi:Glycosyltransferase family 10 (fucosyltransferase) C-term
MSNVTTYCGWDLHVADVSRPVDLFVDDRWNKAKQIHNGSVKILFLCEPRSILRNMAGIAIANQASFDFILTHDEEVLQKCPNARLFEFGTTWISDEFHPNKEFAVSMVVGNKTSAEGHRLRHEVWQRQREIIQPRKFMLSKHGGPFFRGAHVLGDSKEPLFYGMFHVAIENSQFKYYFTEKVMDCFRTRTVPIYWGCPNIGDYFNTDGMLLVQDCNGVIQACNSISPELYASMADAIEDNYNRSAKYANISQRLNQKINELFSS